MKYVFYGKKMDITDALKGKALKKLKKLEKFFHLDTEAVIAMGVEKNRHIVEVTIPLNSVIIRAEVESGDMYGSIDQVVDKLEGQIRRNKTRLLKRFHAGGSKAGYPVAASAALAATWDLADKPGKASETGKADKAGKAGKTGKAVKAVKVEEEKDFVVARSKKFSVKPMTVEEAILQMNLLDHVFFIFQNEDTGSMNVVYRRKNGDYGLLEPEV